MRALILIGMLIALLLVAYLTVRDFTAHVSDKGDKATITAIEKAKEAGQKVEQAGQDLEKRLKKITEE